MWRYDNDSEARMKRAMEIVGMKRIVENSDGSFAVPSQTSDVVYEVRLIASSWVCSCPDFENRGIESCKHIYAVRFWIATNTYLQSKPYRMLMVANQRRYTLTHWEHIERE